MRPLKAVALVPALLAVMLVGGLSTGCSSEPAGNPEAPRATLSVRTPVAVGSFFDEYPLLVCDSHGQTGVNCTDRVLNSVTVTADEPSVVEISQVGVHGSSQGRFRLKALAPGRTTIRTELTDNRGGTFTTEAHIEVLAPTRVHVTPRCNHAEAEPPFLYPVSSEITLGYQLHSGSTLLYSEGVPPPIDAGTFQVLPGGLSGLTLRTPAPPQSAVITSHLDPTLRLELQAYDLGSINSVSVELPSDAGVAPFVVSDPPRALPLDLSYGVDGRSVCGQVGSTSRNGVSFTINTLGLCSVATDGGTRLTNVTGRFQVYGRLEGSCVVTAAVEGGTGRGERNLWFKSPLSRKPGRWSWENPTPFGSQVLAFGGTGPSDVWAGGEDGALMRWDGYKWTWHATERRDVITAIWSAAPHDVWAAGFMGVLYHWNGTAWSQVFTGTSQSLRGLWGKSANDVWVVGNNGTLLHYDGVTWKKVNSGTTEHFSSAWGSGEDAWLGSSGGVFRRNGARWEKVLSSATGFFVHGSASNDVWAVGKTTQRWNGSSWSPIDTGGVEFTRVFAAAPNRAWAVGSNGIYQWDGLAWSLAANPAGSPGQLQAIWGASANDVWAGGVAGLLVHLEDNAWKPVTGGVSGAGRWIRDVWASSPTDVWAVGSEHNGSTTRGIILHRTTGGWSVVASIFDPLNAVWGVASNDIWAAGDFGTVLHFDGLEWKPVASGTTKKITDIWGSGSTNVWMVGAGSLLLHWNGEGISKSLLGHCLIGCGDSDHQVVWGTGPNDVWVGGLVDWTDWDLWHYNGFRWSSRTPTTAKKGAVTSIWSSGPNDVWVNAGSLIHWDGTGWTSPFTGYAPGRLYGFGPSDVWAGNLHWDGAKWEIIEAPSEMGPLFGVDTDHLWTVGSFGKVMRYGP